METYRTTEIIGTYGCFVCCCEFGLEKGELLKKQIVLMGIFGYTFCVKLFGGENTGLYCFFFLLQDCKIVTQVLFLLTTQSSASRSRRARRGRQTRCLRIALSFHITSTFPQLSCDQFATSSFLSLLATYAKVLREELMR